MSALAASGAALESFRRPQQPRRREEVRRRERESGAVATSPQKKAHALALSHAAMLHGEKYLSKITRMLELICYVSKCP